jgi:uncharacterized protein (DUF1778 family)
MRKEKMLTIRITEQEKKQLEKDAQEEQRSISGFLLWCWKQWRKSKGKK